MTQPNLTAPRRSFLKRYGQWMPLYLMFLPGAIYLIINNYIPMAGLIIAFKKVNFNLGILKSPFVGFDNFRYLFMTSDAAIITRNTLLYNLAFMLFNTVLGVGLAILICDTQRKRLQKLYQSIILFPFLMSMVIVGYIVYAFLSMQHGIVNKSILPALGMAPVYWYNEPKHWPFILIFVNTWKSVGYGCLIYISSINGIDSAQYEAAAIDGANKWQQIRHVTLPALLSPVITLTLLAVGRIFYSDFGLFYQVTRDSGMLYSTTNVIDTYVYRGLIKQGNISMSSAAGFYQSVVGFVLVLSANLLVRRVSPDDALL